MTCPYLEYRESNGGRAFEGARAYCAVAGSFVQPMRADVCNDRYALDHAEHCEIYRERVDDEDGPADDGSATGDTPGGDVA